MTFKKGDQVKFEPVHWAQCRIDHLEEVTNPEGPFTVEDAYDNEDGQRVVLKDVFNGRSFPSDYLMRA